MPEHDKQLSVVHLEGIEACKEEQSAATCPYPEGSHEGQTWAEGWHERDALAVDKTVVGSDETLEDIKPTHFAVRETDRGDQGALLQIYEQLDEEGKQKLLRYAVELRERGILRPRQRDQSG